MSRRVAQPGSTRSKHCATTEELSRHEAQNAPVATVGYDVDISVRSLLHVANALVEVVQISLFLRQSAVLELETHQRVRCESADEDVVLPRRELVAGVEDHPRRRDHRIPVVDGLFHSVLYRADADAGAAVVETIGDHGPAVVLSGFRMIELVASRRAVFDSP